MKPVERAWRSAWKPADRRPPWQWCEENVRVDDTSPFPGKWRSDTSPWVRELMETFADSTVNEISVMCSAQSAKTQTIMCLLMWAIKEDPGPIQWVMAAQDEAKTFSKTRLLPTILNTPCVEELINSQDIAVNTLEVNFPGAPLLITGANSKSKLQSNPKRYLFLDEVRNYPPGAYEMVRKRVRAFWNSKVITISTPDMANDHVHRAFLQGDRRYWHFECPHCAQLQKLEFKQIKYDTNETTKPGGVWDFDAVAKTIRYECVACAKPITDDAATRKHIANKGRWIRENPHAPSNKVSFTWNALLPPWVRWRDVVEEFLISHGTLRLGDHQPYKAFINETLGEPWEDRLKEVTDFGALLSRRASYTLGDKWADEKERLIAFDKQKDHYRYVCRAFGVDGESRLVEFGRCDTDEQCDEVVARLNVKKYNVMMDSGHEAVAVYRICAKRGWKAFKGTSHEYFAGENEDGEKVRKLYSKTFADPAIGTEYEGRVPKVKLYLWSNPGVKDMLAEWIAGFGPNWTIPSDESAAMNDYISQVTAEKRIEKIDAKGRSFFEWVQVRRDNHYWDCECMMTVAALVSGLVGKKLVKKEAPKGAPTEPVEAEA